MKYKNLLLIVMLAVMGNAYAQQDYDDIYYNPNKKNTTEKTTKKKSKKGSAYIADMGEMDVDIYNRRGDTYYYTPVDTIGDAVSQGEDFVYTQQIQKYYNPTIVVDNSSVLADVLENSYGNVEIIYNGSTPVFSPIYSYWGPGWNCYSPYAWNFTWTPYDSFLWRYGGPYWSPTWGLSWNWGWNGIYYGWPTWGWGPAWRPAPHPNPQWMANHWRPNGNRPVNNRPVGYTSAAGRPGNAHGMRPTAGNQPNFGTTASHRRNPGNYPTATAARPIQIQNGMGSGSRPGGNGNVNIGGNHRPSASVNTNTAASARPSTNNVNTSRPTMNVNTRPATNTGTTHRSTSIGSFNNSTSGSGFHNPGSGFGGGSGSGGGFGGGSRGGGGGGGHRR